ncbi:MAG: dephospho-CoA kinase, partial [Betaproteobacteria bacterium]|nr:dephospho-CoA kinase [Betaproteobacteria bacterium]
MHTPVRIGLTGGIGSGKSTVAQILADLGAAVIDADAISRSLTLAGGLAMPEV